MPDPVTPTDALHAALSDISLAMYYGSADLRAPLQRHVCDVVDEMKATGMKPEHVILAVKGIGYEANLGLAAAPLIEQMVTWGIEQYFKP